MKAILFVLSIILVAPAFADDKAAQALYNQAKDGYEHPTDVPAMEKVISTLDAALAQVQDNDLKYDILVLSSRAIYWKGVRTDGDDAKKAVFEVGQKKAEDAKPIGPDYAEAYFWGGLNLARWAEANGVLSSLFKKNDLMKAMDGAIERVTRDGASGETIDGYGPDRVLGRLYFKLPGFAGGDHDKSVKYLKTTYEKAKDYAINVQYYAETLADGNSSEKALARQILDELLSHDPKTYNPSRVGDTIDEFNDARKLRSQLGN